MERLERATIILALIEKLKNKGSWGGETHIQKATYLLQTLLDVNMGLGFILYKHGPYSFELTDELKSMRADGFLSLEPAPPPYGPVFKKGEMGDILLSDYKVLVTKFGSKIDFISSELGNMGIQELEKLTTAVFIAQDKGRCEDEILATCINKEKPHISIEEALESVKDAEKLIKESKEV